MRIVISLSLIILSACRVVADSKKESDSNRADGSNDGSSNDSKDANTTSDCFAESNTRIAPSDVKKVRDFKACFGQTLYNIDAAAVAFTQSMTESCPNDRKFMGYAFWVTCNLAGGVILDYGCGPGLCSVKTERNPTACEEARKPYDAFFEKVSTLSPPSCESDVDCASFLLTQDPAACRADTTAMIGFNKSFELDETKQIAKALHAVAFLCQEVLVEGRCDGALGINHSDPNGSRCNMEQMTCEVCYPQHRSSDSITETTCPSTFGLTPSKF